jgi:putative intracellular protease/amidase
LGKAGVLQGKAATCYPSMAGELICGTKKEDPVVIDGNSVKKIFFYFLFI